MRRVLVSLAVLVVVASLGVLACAGKPAEVKPLAIQVQSVAVPKFSDDYAWLWVTFNVRNDNDFMVALNGFGYWLSPEGVLIHKDFVDEKIYIPANTTVTVRSTPFIDKARAVVYLIMTQGIGPKDAAGIMAPVWEKLEAGTASITIEGAYNVESGPGNLTDVRYQVALAQ